MPEINKRIGHSSLVHDLSDYYNRENIKVRRSPLTRDPLPTDDHTKDYNMFSLIINYAVNPKRIWMCVEPEENAAVWINISESGGSSVSVFDGIVNSYSALPPASEKNEKLYYIKNDTNNLLGIAEYPKGTYISDGINWFLAQIQATISENTYSLLNISNWSEFIETTPIFSIGDEINYMGNHYKNKTNSFSNILSPDNDNTNWELIKYGEELSFSNGITNNDGSVTLGGTISGEVNIDVSGALTIGDVDPYDPNAVSIMVSPNNILISSLPGLFRMMENDILFEDKRAYGYKKGIQYNSYYLADLANNSLIPKEYADTNFEPKLPTTPLNPTTKFLNGNRQWATIPSSPLSFSNGLIEDNGSVTFGGTVNGELSVDIEGALILGDSDPYDPNAVTLMVASNDIILSSRSMLLQMGDTEVSFEDKREYGNKKGIRLVSYSLDDLQYDSLVPKEYVDFFISDLRNTIKGLQKSYQVEELTITQQIIDDSHFYVGLAGGIILLEPSMMISLNGVILRNSGLGMISNGDYNVSYNGQVVLLNPSDFNVGDNLYIQYTYTILEEE
jgi:hypothetical protein